MPKIRRALLSVYNKERIVLFARNLNRLGVKILSTGKTARLLKANGIFVQEVSEYTGYPELLNGRVKTLHPKIHAAVLADRSNPSHMKTLKRQGIEPIDLVVVDLYPFEEGIRKRLHPSKLHELIDIGGVTLLRAAAKNFKHVTAVPGSDFYEEILAELKRNSSVREATRKRLAHQVFLRTSHYDQVIGDFLGRSDREEELPEDLTLRYRKLEILRYGENPHQKAALYIASGSKISKELSLQGRPLSFNNLLDLDSAYRMVSDFKKPCVTIIKHAAPCGVALGKTLKEAFKSAWNCDPESAFGGVVGLNRTLDATLANEILASGFLEVIGFPKIEKVALRLLRRKKNLRLVPFNTLYPAKKSRGKEFRPLSGGNLLVQTEDLAVTDRSRLRCVTKRKPSSGEFVSLLFAFHVAKHVRSNAIVIAKEEATVGIGGGQPSRVGSVRLAVSKTGEKAEGAVLASDGFFPFPDNVEVAAMAGIRAIIQPGGSVRDKEVIEMCNRYELAMVFTGIRHFKH